MPFASCSSEAQTLLPANFLKYNYQTERSALCIKTLIYTHSLICAKEITTKNPPKALIQTTQRAVPELSPTHYSVDYSISTNEIAFLPASENLKPNATEGKASPSARIDTLKTYALQTIYGLPFKNHSLICPYP